MSEPLDFIGTLSQTHDEDRRFHPLGRLVPPGRPPRSLAREIILSEEILKIRKLNQLGQHWTSGTAVPPFLDHFETAASTWDLPPQKCRHLAGTEPSKSVVTTWDSDYENCRRAGGTQQLQMQSV